MKLGFVIGKERRQHTPFKPSRLTVNASSCVLRSKCAIFILCFGGTSITFVRESSFFKECFPVKDKKALETKEGLQGLRRSGQKEQLHTWNTLDKMLIGIFLFLFAFSSCNVVIIAISSITKIHVGFFALALGQGPRHSRCARR